MNQEPTVEQMVEALIEKFQLKLDEIPEFKMIEVDQARPQKIANSVIECGRAAESVADAHAEIPIIRTHLRNLRRELEKASKAFDPEVFDNASAFLRDYHEHLEIRQKALTTNLNVLRGLMSQISKNSAAFFGNQVTEPD